MFPVVKKVFHNANKTATCFKAEKVLNSVTKVILRSKKQHRPKCIHRKAKLKENKSNKTDVVKFTPAHYQQKQTRASEFANQL